MLSLLKENGAVKYSERERERERERENQRKKERKRDSRAKQRHHKTSYTFIKASMLIKITDEIDLSTIKQIRLANGPSE